MRSSQDRWRTALVIAKLIAGVPLVRDSRSLCTAIRNGLFADAGILATDRAEAAMLAVDRAKYCQEPDPYLDRPRRIGYNVTISAPHMVNIYFICFICYRTDTCLTNKFVWIFASLHLHKVLYKYKKYIYTAVKHVCKNI